MGTLRTLTAVTCTSLRHSFSRRPPKISVLTDFGDDEATYAVKSAISHVNPSVRVSDICHSIPFGNILVGAWRLYRTVTLPTESAGTVYIAVVDPGVGTARKGLVVQTKTGKFLVGPDNGLLSLAANAEGIAKAVEIQNTRFTLLHLAQSATFHGKDVFAPVAAHLARGVPLAEFGPELDPALLRSILLESESSYFHRTGSLVDIDAYGNVRTCIQNHVPPEFIGRVMPFSLTAPGIDLEAKARLVRTFGDCTSTGELAFVLSSTGALDMVVNQGNAAKQFGLTLDHLVLDDALKPAARIKLDFLPMPHEVH